MAEVKLRLVWIMEKAVLSAGITRRPKGVNEIKLILDPTQDLIKLFVVKISVTEFLSVYRLQKLYPVED